ncbi:unnamed protein product, partial [Prorocentrum cordatum]
QGTARSVDLSSARSAARAAAIAACALGGEASDKEDEKAGGAEGGHRARERSGGAGGPGERGGAGHGAAEAAEITSTPPARCGAGRTGAARRAPARPRTATGAPCPDQRLRCGSAGLVLPPSQRLQVCPACRDAGPPRGGAAGASAPSVRRRP